MSAVTDTGPGPGEVVVSFQDETLLLAGDPVAVESYLTRLRTTAGHAMRVAGIDGAALANAACGLAGLARLLADSGKYVQLHRDSLNALQDRELIPGGDGFFRMMTRAEDGQFLAQLQWRPAGLGPEAMLSAQMIAMQMALKSAVAEVEDAVRRVEDKVELVLEVARAQRAGDVLGNNLTISRMVDSLDKYGSLPDAYWDSVAALGPALNATVEQLRNHVMRILASFDHTTAVQQRAAKLRNAINDNRIGDALSLLVIAEESLHKWQRLSLARIESTQPEQLLRAIDEARELVDHHLREDIRVYRSAKETLDRFAKSEALDGFRFWAVRELAERCARPARRARQFRQGSPASGGDLGGLPHSERARRRLRRPRSRRDHHEPSTGGRGPRGRGLGCTAGGAVAGQGYRRRISGGWRWTRGVRLVVVIAAECHFSSYDSREMRKKWPVLVSVHVMPAGSLLQVIEPRDRVSP